VSLNWLATFLTSELTVVDAPVTFVDASLTIRNSPLSPSADMDRKRSPALDLDLLAVDDLAGDHHRPLRSALSSTATLRLTRVGR
jgi:hypothetical protein